jgi:hypothetical protein
MPSSTTAILPMFHAASVFMRQLLVSWVAAFTRSKTGCVVDTRNTRGDAAVIHDCIRNHWTRIYFRVTARVSCAGHLFPTSPADMLCASHSAASERSERGQARRRQTLGHRLRKSCGLNFRTREIISRFFCAMESALTTIHGNRVLMATPISPNNVAAATIARP